MDTMKHLLIFSSIFFPLFGFTQFHYSDYKARCGLSCGLPDSASIVNSQRILDSLASVEFASGKMEYLYDRGWTYYLRYMKWKEKDDLQQAVNLWEEGWEKHHDLVALKNLGSAWRHLDNCTKALNYTELYLQEVPDSIPVNYKQIYLNYKFCRGKK